MREALGKVTAYSPGVVVPSGKLVLVSGTVAMNEDGEVVGEGSVSEQARFIFASIDQLLRQSGGSVADVVKITTYLTDMSRYKEFAEVRAEVFSGAEKPASSTIGIAALVDPRLLIEIEAMAVLGDRG